MHSRVQCPTRKLVATAGMQVMSVHTDEELLCPYCKEKCPSGASACSGCGATFPWVREIAEIRDQLKERETSRLRATTTLVDELFRSSRGEGAVSLSALKGFVGAWLFPRALIVIGSLAGVIILGMQTYILWSQSKMLASQAEAAKEDRANRLRERLMIVRGSLIQLKVAHAAFPPKGMWFLGCGPDSECGRTEIHALIYAAHEPSDSEAARAFGDGISNIRMVVDGIRRATPELPLQISKTTQGEQNISDIAAIQCLFDPDKALQIKRATEILYALEKHSWNNHLVAALVADDERNLFSTAVRDLTSLYTTRLSPMPDDLHSFLTNVYTLINNVGSGWEALIERCSEMTDNDFRALTELYR
jgi:hypothetical protein